MLPNSIEIDPLLFGDTLIEGDALVKCASEGESAKVAAMLALGFDQFVETPDKNGDRVLHYAARNGHAEVVSLLCMARSCVNAKGVYGRTPLHIAAFGGHLEVVDILLAFGADPHAVTASGDTALHLAADAGHRADRLAAASGGRVRHHWRPCG
eukprot:jgi/Mesvir1/28568/Mv03459-RA.1